MSRTPKVIGLLLVGALLLVAGVAGFTEGSGAATVVAPKNTVPPTISGTPEEGKTLTATTGTWTGTAPITYAYRWLRCDTNGGACSNIGGATASTYQLRKVDVGNTLRVRVTATNSAGSANASSVPTAVIRAAATPPPAGCGGNAPIQIASVGSPERLLVAAQSISPSVVGRSTQRVTLRFQVTCRGKAVQGALVYATAVPFNQFTVPAEQATGADGWAQMTMTQLSGFPAATQQQLLVVFVRARKGGEDLLGGVSSRRLVSFPVDLRR
ncbi:MAG TPA: hypothetical protein VML35_09925 [Gaiellaceae bacterium]|nr:hypothetical protein [Gaiellaceae bacterium]